MKIIVKYHLSEEGKKKAVAAGLDDLCEQEIHLDDPAGTMSQSAIGVAQQGGDADTLLFDLCRRGHMVWENNRKNYYLKDFHYNPLAYSHDQWREFLKRLLRLYGLTRFNVQMGVNQYLDEPITSLDDLRKYEEKEKATVQKMEELVAWVNEEYVKLSNEIHENAQKAIAGFAAR